MKDGLTSLLTHTVIHKELEKEFQMSKRYNLILSLMFIDIDDFKKYNDEFGHKIGDMALIVLSDIFRQSLRKTDTIGRYGGEEFLIILPHTNKRDSLSLGKKLIKSIQKETSKNKKLPKGFTVSIGISQIKADMENSYDLIEEADMAMYRAKRDGKNSICCVD